MALSFLQVVNSASDLTTYTFSTQSLGTAAATRYIICCFSGRSIDGGARTITSVTIGGVTATQSKFLGTSGSHTGICIVAVPTGTTGDVVLVWSGGMGNCTCALYRVTDISSTTPTDSGTSAATPPTYAINCNAGGIIIATCTEDIGGSAPQCAWTGLTEDYDTVTYTGGNFLSGASANPASAQTNLTVTATWPSYGRGSFCVVSYPLSTGYTHKIFGITPSKVDGTTLSATSKINGL